MQGCTDQVYCPDPDPTCFNWLKLRSCFMNVLYTAVNDVWCQSLVNPCILPTTVCELRVSRRCTQICHVDIIFSLTREAECCILRIGSGRLYVITNTRDYWLLKGICDSVLQQWGVIKMVLHKLCESSLQSPKEHQASSCFLECLFDYFFTSLTDYNNNDPVFSSLIMDTQD